MNYWNTRRMVAALLSVMMVVMTAPVSAAELVSTSKVIGSISVAGPVELRGHLISREGTLFAGDKVRAGDKGYAKLQLKDGSKFEIGSKSEIRLNPKGETVQIAMATGNLGFTAMGRSAVSIALLPFEIIATDGAAGNISVTSGTAAGVRAVKGEITVHNTETSERFVLASGDERWLSMEEGSIAPSIDDMEAGIPAPLPSVPAQTPAGQSTGLQMDAGAWAAVILGAAVTGIALYGLKTALDNKDKIEDLNSQISGLDGRITGLSGQITNLGNQIGANQAANAAAIAGLQQAAVLSEAAFNARLNALAIQLTANQAVSAVSSAPNLTAAQRSAFTARAQSIASQANSTTQNILSLESQINALESQIASSGTITSAQQTQLNNLQNQLNAAIQNLNTIRRQETQLLLDLSNAGVSGITQTSQNSGGASASVPTK